MLESINFDSPVSVYKQIENQVCFAVLTGKLKAGDRLPTGPELSKRLNLHWVTITKAFGDLAVMGVVYARRGKGVFIEKDAQRVCRDRFLNQVVGRIYEVASEAKAQGVSKTEFGQLVKAAFDAEGTLYGPLPKSLESLIKK